MALTDCPVCGEDHPRCNGHKKIRDEDRVVVDRRPCMAWPRPLEDVCQFHGGHLPGVVAKGVRDRAAQVIEADVSAVVGYDLSGTVADPIGLIEGVLASEVAMMQALGARVNAERELSYESKIGTEQLRASVMLFERSRDRVMKYVEIMLKHRPDGEAAATRNLLSSLADKLAQGE